jgi:hypothetical protein
MAEYRDPLREAAAGADMGLAGIVQGLMKVREQNLLHDKDARTNAQGVVQTATQEMARLSALPQTPTTRDAIAQLGAVIDRGSQILGAPKGQAWEPWQQMTGQQATNPFAALGMASGVAAAGERDVRVNEQTIANNEADVRAAGALAGTWGDLTSVDGKQRAINFLSYAESLIDAPVSPGMEGRRNAILQQARVLLGQMDDELISRVRGLGLTRIEAETGTAVANQLLAESVATTAAAEAANVGTRLANENADLVARTLGTLANAAQANAAAAYIGGAQTSQAMAAVAESEAQVRFLGEQTRGQALANQKSEFANYTEALSHWTSTGLIPDNSPFKAQIMAQFGWDDADWERESNTRWGQYLVDAENARQYALLTTTKLSSDIAATDAGTVYTGAQTRLADASANLQTVTARLLPVESASRVALERTQRELNAAAAAEAAARTAVIPGNAASENALRAAQARLAAANEAVQTAIAEAMPKNDAAQQELALASAEAARASAEHSRAAAATTTIQGSLTAAERDRILAEMDQAAVDAVRNEWRFKREQRLTDVADAATALTYARDAMLAGDVQALGSILRDLQVGGDRARHWQSAGLSTSVVEGMLKDATETEGGRRVVREAGIEQIRLTMDQLRREGRTADVTFGNFLREIAATNFTPDELDTWYGNLNAADRRLVDQAGGMTVLRERSAIGAVVRAEPLKQAAMSEASMLLSLPADTPEARAQVVDQVYETLREAWGEGFANQFREGAARALAQGAQRWEWEALKTELDFGYLEAQTTLALSQAGYYDRMPQAPAGAAGRSPQETISDLMKGWQASISANEARAAAWTAEYNDPNRGCVIRNDSSVGGVTSLMVGPRASSDECVALATQIRDAALEVDVARGHITELAYAGQQLVTGQPVPRPTPAPAPVPAPAPAPEPAAAAPAAPQAPSVMSGLWAQGAAVLGNDPASFERMVRATIPNEMLLRYASANGGDRVRIEAEAARLIGVDRDTIVRPILAGLAQEAVRPAGAGR